MGCLWFCGGVEQRVRGRIFITLFALPFFGVGVWMLWDGTAEGSDPTSVAPLTGHAAARISPPQHHRSAASRSRIVDVNVDKWPT